MHDVLYRNNAAQTTTALPRIVDAPSLLHLRASKSAKACDAADAVDGLVIVQNPTLRMAAATWGVSLGSVARARHLPPEQRERVRRGERPLVLPATMESQSMPVSPAMMAVELVDAVGIDTSIDLLIEADKNRVNGC